MSITLEVGHEKQGVRTAYVDGAPGIRASIHNEVSGLMFWQGGDLMFSIGTDLMFENPEPTYPGFKTEIV